MSSDRVLRTTANVVMYGLAAVQTDQFLQYIELGLSILISLVILIERIVHWAKAAKADGKVTSEEVVELLDITKDGFEGMKKETEKFKGDKHDN